MSQHETPLVSSDYIKKKLIIYKNVPTTKLLYEKGYNIIK